MSSTGADRVIRRALEVQRLVPAYLATGMARAMEMLQHWVRTEHTFHNRTGKTEETTIGGVYEQTTEKIVGVISSGMSYDYFLELARAGEWAYLWPILMAHREEILQIITDAGLLGGPPRK